MSAACPVACVLNCQLPISAFTKKLNFNYYYWWRWHKEQANVRLVVLQWSPVCPFHCTAQSTVPVSCWVGMQTANRCVRTLPIASSGESNERVTISGGSSSSSQSTVLATSDNGEHMNCRRTAISTSTQTWRDTLLLTHFVCSFSSLPWLIIPFSPPPLEDQTRAVTGTVEWGTLLRGTLDDSAALAINVQGKERAQLDTVPRTTLGKAHIAELFINAKSTVDLTSNWASPLRTEGHQHPRQYLRGHYAVGSRRV